MVPGKKRIAQIRYTHKCNYTGCINCQTQYPLSEAYQHHCPIIPITEQKKFTWVAFAYFMEENQSETNCFQCFRMETNCALHEVLNSNDFFSKESRAQVNLISFAYQSGHVFRTHIFKDENINTSLPLVTNFEASSIFHTPEKSILHNTMSNTLESEHFLKQPFTGLNVTEQLLHTILMLSAKGKFTIYVNMFGLAFLLHCLITHNFKPIIQQQDSSIMSISLLNVKFLNINLLFDNVFIWKHFATDMHFFPLPLNLSVLYDAKNLKPALRYFLHYDDTLHVRQTKTIFWDKKGTKKWHFGDELVKSANSWLIIYYKLFKMYLELARDLQDELSLAYGKPMERWNPLTKPFITSTSFLHKLMIALASFKSHKLFGVRHGEKGIYHRSSKGEFQYIQYIIHVNGFDPAMCQHAYNMPYGTECVYGTYPDLIATSGMYRTYFFYSGCFFHQHAACPTDSLHFPCLYKSKSAINYSRYKSYMEKMAIFRSNLTATENVIEGWECWFHSNVKPTDYYKAIARNFIKRPKRRLKPRLACKGPIVEAFHAIWESRKHGSLEFYVLDKVKFYLSLLTNLRICRNDYHVYIAESDMKKIHFNVANDAFEKDGVQCYGLAMVRVFPPKNCIYPILSYKQEDTKRAKFRGLKVTPLCAQCCMSNNRKLCTHDDFQRSFIGDLTFLEINYAFKMGYTFIFYEAYLYDIETPQCIFQKFAQKVEEISLRYENSGDRGEIIKAKYLKKMVVGALGRFALKPKEAVVELLNNVARFQQLIARGQIFDFNEVTANTLLIARYKNGWWRQDDSTACLTLSAYITASARIAINETMYKIHNAGGTVYLASTDCLYFTLNRDICITSSKFPVQIGKKMGQFAYELTPIIKRVCILGARNYAILYATKLGIKQMKIVMGGFSLTRTIMSVRKLTFKLIKAMIVAYLESLKVVFESIDLLKRKQLVYRTLPLAKYRINYSKAALINVKKENYTRKQIIKFENNNKVNYCYVPFGFVRK